MSEHVVGHIKGRKVWGSEKRGEEERRGKGGGGQPNIISSHISLF